jgi:hypothetical protein
MRDFLGNLVSRSLGAAQLIQPRLPSLFEEAMPYALSPTTEQPAMEQIGQPQSTSNRSGLRNPQAGPELPLSDERPLFVQQPARTSVNRHTERLPSKSQAESPSTSSS